MLNLISLPNIADLNLNERVVIGRLIVLTDGGAHSVMYTPALAFSELGLKRRTYFRVIDSLSVYDYISRDTTNVWLLALTSKLLADLVAVSKWHCECQIGTDECQIGTDECQIGTVKMSENELNQSLNIFKKNSSHYIYNIYKYINNNINNNNLKKEKENKKEKERRDVSVVKATVLEANVKTARKTKTKIEYPLSAAECEFYFLEFADKHISDFPQLANLNVHFEAEQFFNYWALEHDWTDKNKRKVKSVSGRVATWIQNWCARNKSTFVRTTPTKDYTTVKRLPQFESIEGLEND